jgi:hypothetical protein
MADRLRIAVAAQRAAIPKPAGWITAGAFIPGRTAAFDPLGLQFVPSTFGRRPLVMLVRTALFRGGVDAASRRKGDF